MSGADRLVEAAAEAARLRAYQTHLDVVALGIERVRTQVERMAWAGIALGLLFTMANVQQFAAGDAEPWSLAWCAAWLLDPMVSLVLLALIRAEQVTSRYRVVMGAWVSRARRFCLAATYAMNCWEAWLALDWRLIALHSVPPLLVFVTAEAITQARNGLTDAVSVALAEPGPEPEAQDVATTPPEPRSESVGERAAALVAAGHGRVELQRRLGVTEHAAKQLVKAHRGQSTNGHAHQSERP
ncbi:hypothetical protein [Pseudonocardia pini]|uniref:hypothetical protein n=1 Tax=Pseudonocardia pini TaxID=2758030 RepID=UPI0015F0B4F6|nr:hypothetical protein [Pseudonocardia pini]